MYTVFAVAIPFSILFMNTYLNSVHSKIKINRLCPYGTYYLLIGRIIT